MNPERIRIIKLHKRWADGYTLLWQVFVVLLFGGIYFVLEQFGAGAAERTAAFVLLAVMVLVAAIWQSTGLGIARVHMLLRGIDLETPEEHNSITGETRK
jgi:predicted metal-binding membrane protein